MDHSNQQDPNENVTPIPMDQMNDPFAMQKTIDPSQLLNLLKMNGINPQQLANFGIQDPSTYMYPAQQMLDPSRQKSISRHKFSHEEDEALRSLINEMGTSNWRAISQRMIGRSPRQCRERWKNYLSPAITTSAWSEEEDIQLERLHNELGSQWSAMTKFFPGRTDINIKNHWVTLASRALKLKRKDCTADYPEEVPTATLVAPE